MRSFVYMFVRFTSSLANAMSQDNDVIVDNDVDFIVVVVVIAVVVVTVVVGFNVDVVVGITLFVTNYYYQRQLLPPSTAE